MNRNHSTFNLMNPFKAFQLAKSSFRQLHPASQPDSLTRRGNEIIVRRAYPPGYPMAAWWLRREWEALVQSVLPEASIEESTFDGHNVRVRFVVLDHEFASFLRETREADRVDEAYERFVQDQLN